MASDRLSDRIFVAWKAGDQCCPADLALIQLLNPPLSQIRSRSGIIPPQEIGDLPGRMGAGEPRPALGQNLEETLRKEVAVNVVDRHMGVIIPG